MGLASSKILIHQSPPDKLSEFKKLAAAPDQYNIPEVSQKRVSTDVKCFFVFLICLGILSGFCIYTSIYVDTDRWLYKFDTCGNTCGKKNDYVDGVNCSGKNFEHKRYLTFATDDVLYDGTHWDYYERQCTETCVSGYVISEFSCITADEFNFVVTDNLTEQTNNTKTERPLDVDIDPITGESYDKLMKQCLGYTTVIALVSLVFCLILLMLFRYATALVIWSIIIGSYSIFTIFTGVLWFTGDEISSLCIVCSILWIIVTFMLIAFFKRIPLIINLFREATKAIFTMPGVIFVSLLTFIVLFIIFIIFLVILGYLSNAGVLTQLENNMYTYEPNGVMLFTIFFYIFMILWIWHFIIGIQIMTISGAVSSWYFARDKTFLGSPVMDSFKVVLKYHLGSVAFGSLVISVVKVIKFVLSSMARNKKTKFLAEYCLRTLESIVVYISRNSYIMIAMHGEDFMKSGKRAVQLIYLNINDVIALNSIGDFILFMAKLLVCVWSYYFCTLIYDDKSAVFIIGAVLGILISIVLASIIFGTFETVIETLLLCYCEDCCINDGIDRPYYMTTDLMQFFEESKAVLNKTQ